MKVGSDSRSGTVGAVRETRRMEENPFTLSPMSGQQYALRNTSDRPIRHVAVTARAQQGYEPVVLKGEPTDAELAAGESLVFMVIPLWGAPMPGELWVSWDVQPEPRAVALPPKG